MLEEESDDTTIRFPDSTVYSAVGTTVGLVAVTLMVILSFIFPEEVSGMDLAKSISNYIKFAELYTAQISLFILLDTIFILGYTSLFVGLWLIIRDFSQNLSNIGLALGLMVGFFDIIENSLILVTVNGLQTGWQADESVYTIIFFLNTYIDLLSYLAGLTYAIIFLTIFKPKDPRFNIGLLFIIYSFLGLGSFLYSPLLMMRSLIFIIGLGYGAYILWIEEDIPIEYLEKRMKHDLDSKSDFV